MALADRLRDDSVALAGDLTSLRRDLHRHPEVVDDVMPDGVLLHAQLAVRALRRDASQTLDPTPEGV